MINISYDELEDGTLSITMEGHSKAAEPGKDLICAAASMLCYTLAQNVEDFYGCEFLLEKPKIDLKWGKAVIAAKPNEESEEFAKHLFITIWRGFQVLAANHPGNVGLTHTEATEGASLPTT